MQQRQQQRLAGSPIRLFSITYIIITIIDELTGDDDDVGDRVEGLEAGGDDYLAKPYESSVLIARLEALLRRASMSREAGGACTMRAGVSPRSQMAGALPTR